VVLAVAVLHVGSAGFGLMEAVMALGSVIGIVLVPRLTTRIPRERLFVFSLLAFGLFEASVGAFPNFTWVLIAFMISGALNMGFIIPVRSILQLNTPPEMRTRTFAAFGAATNGAVLIGTFVAGALEKATWLPPGVPFGRARRHGHDTHRFVARRHSVLHIQPDAIVKRVRQGQSVAMRFPQLEQDALDMFARTDEVRTVVRTSTGVAHFFQVVDAHTIGATGKRSHFARSPFTPHSTPLVPASRISGRVTPRRRQRPAGHARTLAPQRRACASPHRGSSRSA